MALIQTLVLGPLSLTTLLLIVLVADNIAIAKDEDRLPRELAWVQASAEKSQFLNRTKAECLNPKARLNSLQGIKLGRLAFQSPRLLGGQASRRV